jgi:hypothetical protein
VDFKIAEAAAKSDVLLFRKLLTSEDDHTTIVQDILDSSECVACQRFSKIQTCDFGSKGSSSVADIHRKSSRNQLDVESG